MTCNFTICVGSSRQEIYYKSKTTAIDMKFRGCATALQSVPYCIVYDRGDQIVGRDSQVIATAF